MLYNMSTKLHFLNTILYSLISAESHTSMMISDDEELEEVKQDARIEMTAAKVPRKYTNL